MNKYRRNLIYQILIVAGILAAGCGSTRVIEKTEYVIKHDTLRVPVHVITDSFRAIIDSAFIHGEKIVGQDTVIEVRYYPEEKKIYVKVKPDTVYVPVTDTIAVIRKAEIIKEPGFWEKNFWYIIFILLAIIVILILIKIKIN